MALRWRKTGEIVCAAETKSMIGDIYITDNHHYDLKAFGLIKTDDDGTTWEWVLGSKTAELVLGEIIGLCRAEKFINRCKKEGLIK